MFIPYSGFIILLHPPYSAAMEVKCDIEGLPSRRYYPSSSYNNTYLIHNSHQHIRMLSELVNNTPEHGPVSVMLVVNTVKAILLLVMELRFDS